MNTVISLISIFILLLWIPEIFIYSGVLRIPVGILSFVIGMGLCIWRLRTVIAKNQFILLRKLLFMSAIVSNGISLILIILEQSMFTNYVFSHFHIHMRPLVYFSVWSFLLWLFALPNVTLMKRWRKIVFYLSIYISYIFILIGTFPNDYLYLASKEDSVLAYVQVFFLLCSIAVMMRGAITHASWRRGVFVLFVVLFIFLAGEEISWGQRLFNIQSSDYFMKNNAQEEITVHNLKIIGYSPIVLSYIGIGVIFTYGWLLRKLKFHRGIFYEITKFAPRWYTGFYFYPILLYNIYTALFDHGIGNLAEPTECLMYLGFFLYAVTTVYDLE